MRSCGSRPASSTHRRRHRGWRRCAALTQPIAATMYGAMGGTATGGIVGALIAYGSASSRLWRDSWILIASAMATRGDSGAFVVDNNTKEAIGIVVGGSCQPASTNFAVQYVQDLSSLQGAVLHAKGITLKLSRA